VGVHNVTLTRRWIRPEAIDEKVVAHDLVDSQYQHCEDCSLFGPAQGKSGIRVQGVKRSKNTDFQPIAPLAFDRRRPGRGCR
jgi:hypothetical protein